MTCMLGVVGVMESACEIGKARLVLIDRYFVYPVSIVCQQRDKVPHNLLGHAYDGSLYGLCLAF